jgi:hypothetical protein
MSEVPDDINIRDVLARIDRQQAETRKFVAEQGKLQAEDLKLQRDRRLLPVTVIATLLGAGAAIFAAGAGFFKLVGG